MLASIRDEALWRYDIKGRSEKSDFRVELRVIETPEGEPAGALVHSRKLRRGRLGALLYEVVPGVAFLAATDSVMRYLYSTGEEYSKRDGEEFEAFGFSLGEQHPVYDTVLDRLPRVRKPYAWYIRVPDIPAFVRHITPALEERLAGSAQSGYTGEMKVSFYRSGLLFKFQEGSISVEGWKPDRVEEGDAAFPDLTFLQLLFGYRDLDELQHAFPDCRLSYASADEVRALLGALFPKQTSLVLPVG